MWRKNNDDKICRKLGGTGEYSEWNGQITKR